MSGAQKAIEYFSVLSDVKRENAQKKEDISRDLDLFVAENCNIAVAAIQEKQRNDELRQQRRLVELPCAVGDTVYALVSTENGYIIKKMQVKEIQLKHRSFGDAVFMLEPAGRRGCLFKYYEMDFSKAVFLTPEAAQEAQENIDQ